MMGELDASTVSLLIRERHKFKLNELPAGPVISYGRIVRRREGSIGAN